MCLHLGKILITSPFSYSSKHIAQSSASVGSAVPYMMIGNAASSSSSDVVVFSSFMLLQGWRWWIGRNMHRKMVNRRTINRIPIPMAARNLQSGLASEDIEVVGGGVPWKLAKKCIEK